MQLKLLAALPPERQAAAERLAGRFHLDPLGWYQTPDEGERLPAIAQAVWTSRRIAVRYVSWKGEVERTLEPLGLILKGGLWYLAARPAGVENNAPRTYRVSNILSLTALEESFERPKDFDLSGWWAETSRRFEAEILTGEARLLLTTTGLNHLKRLGSKPVQVAAGHEAESAWIEVIVPMESIEHAMADILRLGAEAQVLAPPELRDCMRGMVDRMAALYA